MTHASERDLFARSISGDWQSRKILYKKFVHENSRVRRLGARFSNVDDFLHDCFTNLLRASHTFKKGSRLSERVETLAAWTAIERARTREIESPGVSIVIRLCAAVEGDETDQRNQLTYVPPRSGSADSLSSRISAIVGESSFQLLRSLAAENATWDSAAAAARKPLNVIGPTVVRAVDRLARYFGAPPPLNDDLAPIFSEVSAEEAAWNADPFKPKGRVIPMQLDPVFHSVTPETRKLGLTVPAEVRTITLWDAARASSPPAEALRAHLDQCHYCAEVLRSLLLLQQALLSRADADFLLCPGASTLMRDQDDGHESLHKHLEECTLCRDERKRTLWGDAVQPDGNAASDGMTPGRKIAWVAAAVILIGVIFFVYWYFKKGEPEASGNAPATEQSVPEAPPINPNSKYAALAEHVSLDTDRVMGSVLLQDQFDMIEARNYLKRGNRTEALFMTEAMVNKYNDPGAQMLYAFCLYPRSPADGYRAMLKAEGMPPRNTFRCWSTLQCALLIGDRAIAEREIEHLSSDREFGLRAKNILARMKAMK